MDGENIRILRQMKGYKQEYLATKLGITTKAYSKLEHGEIKLSTDRLREIARILGFKPEEVINFDPQSFLKVTKSGDDPLVELSGTTRHHYEQRIQYLEGEVKFLRDLLKKISGVSS